jgi:hypothetical protein
MPARIEELFQQTLVRPSHEMPNLVHLTRALAILSGADGVAGDGATAALAEMIGPADHLVFVLVDGLGMNIMKRLPADTFLGEHVRMQIHATCPSTTACALTTVATAEYPAAHGVTGWYTYVPELKITATILPFQERFSGQSLRSRDLRVEDLIPLRPVCVQMKHEPMSFTPSYISDTPYNSYARANTSGVGYKTLTDGVLHVIDRVCQAKSPTYTHLYLPDVDTLCHHVGVEHRDVLPLVMHIDAELRRLADELAGKARIVISADHGLIDVPRHNQALLFLGDPLLELLEVPPSGDARMPIFHVREGRHEAFVEMFQRRFGDRMVLLSVAEAEDLHLFGPDGLSEKVRRRFGDFIAIPFRPVTLAYHPMEKPTSHLFLAVHGGLSPEEMWVPLCIA